MHLALEQARLLLTNGFAAAAIAGAETSNERKGIPVPGQVKISRHYPDHDVGLGCGGVQRTEFVGDRILR